MSLLHSKALPVATIMMSVPLLLSYNIKYGVFPAGLPFVLLYSWGLMSVIAVPILLFTECVVTLRLLKSRYIAGRTTLLALNAVALGIASLAGLIFVIVRNGSR